MPVNTRQLKEAMRVLAEGLKQGTGVSLKGFGRFELVRKAARLGRNPANGESIQIPEKTVVKFHPTSSFKKEISGVEVMVDHSDEE